MLLKISYLYERSYIKYQISYILYKISDIMNKIFMLCKVDILYIILDI